MVSSRSLVSAARRSSGDISELAMLFRSQISTYRSFCRMGYAKSLSKHRRSRRFKVLGVKIELLKSSIVAP